jgi:hypothetical protein
MEERIEAVNALAQCLRSEGKKRLQQIHTPEMDLRGYIY